MPKFRKILTKKIGRRNLPFVAAVVVLGLFIILLMYLAPKPYSDRGTATPAVISTE